MGSKNVMVSAEYIAEQEEEQPLPSILIRNTPMGFSFRTGKRVFSFSPILFYIYTHEGI